MDMLIIFSNMRNNKVYNGNTEKFGISCNGKDYIVKLSKDNDLSVFSEYIASKIIQCFKVPCHNVELGIYNSQIVNLLEDFTYNTVLSLHSFKDTKQSSEDTDVSVKEYTYSDVLYLIDKHLKMSYEAKKEAKNHFWNMFICDAILANRDRHWGNWGYLAGSNTGYRIAPLYDNGASLYPGVYEVIPEFEKDASRRKFLYDRVFVFPDSLFKVKRGDRSYRTNYYEMFENISIYPEFEQRVEYFKSNFSCEQVFFIVKNIVKDLPIPDLYKRFYIQIIVMRYGCIVLRQDFESLYSWLESYYIQNGDF